LRNKSAENGKHRDTMQSLAASLMCIDNLPDHSKPSFLVILCDDLEYRDQVEKGIRSNGVISMRSEKQK
jgi:hypothetical protein